VILLGRLDSASLPSTPLISAVTFAELAIGPLLASSEEERAVRAANLSLAQRAFEPLPFGVVDAVAFVDVAVGMRARGRKQASRSCDALIAATAIANRLPLYTVNPRDFIGISALTLVSIPHPDARP
jgi:hypothetical protein